MHGFTVAISMNRGRSRPRAPRRRPSHARTGTCEPLPVGRGRTNVDGARRRKVASGGVQSKSEVGFQKSGVPHRLNWGRFGGWSRVLSGFGGLGGSIFRGKLKIRPVSKSVSRPTPAASKHSHPPDLQVPPIAGGSVSSSVIRGRNRLGSRRLRRQFPVPSDASSFPAASRSRLGSTATGPGTGVY